MAAGNDGREREKGIELRDSQGVMTVSYTHLDVYKRQVFIFFDAGAPVYNECLKF